MLDKLQLKFHNSRNFRIIDPLSGLDKEERLVVVVLDEGQQVTYIILFLKI